MTLTGEGGRNAGGRFDFGMNRPKVSYGQDSIPSTSDFFQGRLRLQNLVYNGESRQSRLYRVIG